MSEREREGGIISCDVKQDGGFLRGIKQQEEEKGCRYRRWCHFDFEATEKKKGSQLHGISQAEQKKLVV